MTAQHADSVRAVAAPKHRVRDFIVTAMRKRGWNHRTPGEGLRHRAYALASERHRWWDWGHRLMILVGSDDCGNWGEPEPPTWWYRLGEPKKMLRTKHPRHPLSTFEIVTDYDEFKRKTKGLNEDEMYAWKAICVNQDGELILGHRYWGGNFYGMPKWETALLRRYLRKWRRLDWYGLRSWLYSQALHAAVNQKIPFKCHAAPPSGSGGYSHWLCDQKRKHAGPHRFRNYEWTEGKVEHTPTKQEIDHLEGLLHNDGRIAGGSMDE